MYGRMVDEVSDVFGVFFKGIVLLFLIVVVINSYKNSFTDTPTFTIIEDTNNTLVVKIKNMDSENFKEMFLDYN